MISNHGQDRAIEFHMIMQIIDKRGRWEDSLQLFVDDVAAGSKHCVSAPRRSTLADLLSQVASQAGLTFHKSSVLEFRSNKLHDCDKTIDSLGLEPFSTLRLISPQLLGGSVKGGSMIDTAERKQGSKTSTSLVDKSEEQY